MKFRDIKSQLINKTRTVKDVSRYINENGALNLPPYSFFLGAGASVTSGIKSGQNLTDEWRKEIYEQIENTSYFKEDENSEDPEIIEIAKCRATAVLSQQYWYNSQKEYSCLFERKYDMPSQRRRFIEQVVDKKNPSIGYLYLLSLINHQKINTIFTTNFDDLLNDAFYQFSDQRPQVCAHDSSITSLSVLASRPKIIKLHGDYW